MKLQTLFEQEEKDLTQVQLDGRKVVLNGKPRDVWEGKFIYRDRGNGKLTSLVGAPKRVNGDFVCSNQKLTSLKGSPEVVNGFFSCTGNLLTNIDCSLELAQHFYCFGNRITSLKDIHKHVKELKGGAFPAEAEFNAKDNPIASHVLGLLKIKGLKHFFCDNAEVEEIINKYLPEGDIFECQSELIDAGFEEYAKL